jgi:hypothetical protein
MQTDGSATTQNLLRLIKRIMLVSENTEERQSSEKPATDAPQEEFIQQQAVPSQPREFGGKETDKKDQPGEGGE